MQIKLSHVVLALVLGLFPSLLLAQDLPGSNGLMMGGGMGLENMANTNRQGQKVIAVRVYSEDKHGLDKVRLEVTNNAGLPHQSGFTDKTGYIEFTFSMFVTNDETNFVATIKATKKRYEIGQSVVFMDRSVHGANSTIYLHRIEASDDSNLLSRADLIQGLVPRLEERVPTEGLSPKQQNNYFKALGEFQKGKYLDVAIIDLHRVSAANPSCLKCRTMLGLAELKWNDDEDARIEIGEAVNAIIKNPKLGIPEPLIAYGTLVSWKHDPAKASVYFLGALTYSPKDPLALQELGRTQYQEMNFYAANQTLKKALAAGAGPDAKLLHAEALLWAGTPQEASDELNKYMGGRPFKELPAQAQVLQANIQEKFKDATAFNAYVQQAKMRGVEPLDYLEHPPIKDLKEFTPATDQSQLSAILAAVGKNVSGLFTDLPNICAIEKVRQEQLDHKGKDVTARNSKYRYLAMIPSNPWGPSMDEYRADASGIFGKEIDFSDSAMLTEGFVSAPLVFHPAYQPGSTFRLLGTQMVDGLKMYVIAYAQVPAKSSLYGTFTYGTTVKITYTQGMAWVDADTDQITHITSDLLQPVPEVNLDKETTDIYFSPVQFRRLAEKFMLPEAVTVTLDWGGKTFRNRHSYSDFLVSNVEEMQKIEDPKKDNLTPVKDGGQAPDSSTKRQD